MVFRRTTRGLHMLFSSQMTIRTFDRNLRKALEVFRQFVDVIAAGICTFKQPPDSNCVNLTRSENPGLIGERSPGTPGSILRLGESH